MKTSILFILKTARIKPGIIFILCLAFSILFPYASQAQFPFIQRKVWDGPYDIKMIAAPNLDPVFLNASQAASGNLLADSLITYSIMQRTGDLFEINNRYKEGTPFKQYDIPTSSFLCPDPNTACNNGQEVHSDGPNSSCPIERYSGPAYINKYVSMSYADYDTDLTTYSSSMATLDISQCSEIEAAYLYWTGMFRGSNDPITLIDGPLTSYSGSGNVFNTSSTSGQNQVKFKIPGGAYQTVTATAANTRNSASRYLCVADVTAIVQGTGGGEFWVGNVQSYPNEGDGGSTSGWTLVVIFRSPLSPPRLISLWDGLESIDMGDSEIFTLTGLQAPATNNFKSYVGFGALDGENIASQLDGDTPEGLGFQTNAGGALFDINPYATDQAPYKLYNKKGYPALCDGSDNISSCKKPLYDANWCSVFDGVSSSHISSYNEATDKNGNEIVRLPSNKNTLGFDAHHMILPDGAVAPNATEATLTVKAGPQGGTTPFLAYVAIERLQPKLELSKYANNTTTTPGSSITYTLRIRNQGNTASLGAIIYDTLDIATDFSAGSLSATHYVNGTGSPAGAGVSLLSIVNDNIRIQLSTVIQPKDSVDIIFTVQVKDYAGNATLWDVECKRSILNVGWVKYRLSPTDSDSLISKSNSNDCGIGTETRVLVSGFTNAATTVIGPIDACPNITDNSLPHIKAGLISLGGVSSSIIDEFDIRDDNNVRVQPTDIFSSVPNNSMSYFAYRDVVSGGNCQQIYEVQFSSCVLPIELLSFTGWKENNINALVWVTATEKNNHYFIIERSINGIDFSPVGTLQGNGNSSTVQNYTFEDEQPANGNNYYRLKQVDYDGTSSYSKVIVILNSQADFDIYPNPNNGEFTIRFMGPDQSYTLDITDINGRIVYSISGDKVPENLEVYDLSKGFYIVRFYQGQHTNIKKLVVY